MNCIYDNLLKSDKVRFISPKAFSLHPIVSSNKTRTEPGRSRKFVRGIALKKKVIK